MLQAKGRDCSPVVWTGLFGGEAVALVLPANLSARRAGGTVTPFSNDWFENGAKIASRER
jgi:hypothetical protein